MSKAVFYLSHDTARRRAMSAVADAPAGFKVTVEEPPRSLDQNALLHCLLTEIAGQVEWAGKKRDAECWKRLCTAAWLRARGESIEVLPAIDGHGIDVVFRRTSSLSKGECSELIDFIQAWAASQGVIFERTFA